MLYGYARVSTAGQEMYGNSLGDQRVQLIQAGAQEVFEEHYTGTKMERPEFEKVLGLLKDGDTLIVTKLDRFARNASEGYNTIKGLMDRGVSVNILNMGLCNNTSMGHLMLHVLLAFAEFERDMIVERTQAGKKIARQGEGYREGRRPLSEDVIQKIQDGVSWEDLGISRSVWYKYRSA